MIRLLSSKLSITDKSFLKHVSFHIAILHGKVLKKSSLKIRARGSEEVINGVDSLRVVLDSVDRLGMVLDGLDKAT